jgi:hypothetical protein
MVGPPFHAIVGANPGSATDVRRPTAAEYISILGVLARLVGLAIDGQLLQHDDALDAALTYGVGHQLQCIIPHHT